MVHAFAEGGRAGRAAAVTTLIGLLAGCGFAGAAPRSPAPRLAVSRIADLGPLPGGTAVRISLGLRGAADERVRNVLNAGHLPAAADVAGLSPDSAGVVAVAAVLRRAGAVVRWSPGSSVLEVDATAGVVEHLFQVRLERHRDRHGREYHAPLGAPVIPAALAGVVAEVVGLNNRPVRDMALITDQGLTPEQILHHYGIDRLHSNGLDGAGVTIILPEIDRPPDSGDLASFAQQHGLPDFGTIDYRTSSRWGRADGTPTEITLDLEIAHAVAPRARLVVYAGDAGGGVERALAQAQQDFPTGVISESLGVCELDAPDAARLQARLATRVAAAGGTWLAASGDDGAFGCARSNPDAVDQASVSSLSTPPEITAVGGTSLLGDPNAGSLREVAWAGPIERNGSGGGLSTLFARPGWQRGPGVDSGANGNRQVPDVAALGDPLTGWQIIQSGNVIRAGGTSAAAPLWAGLVALIDQDLQRRKQAPVGFMNPALYTFGAATGAHTFNDVVAGTNLLYQAGPGWDFATGWGGPNAPALLAAFEARASAGGGAQP